MSRLIFYLMLLSLGLSQAMADDSAAISPKKPWGDFETVTVEEPSWITHTLLWIPNRFLDFVDIFRVDAGVGYNAGGTLRLTTYGQAGVHNADPAMLRIGLFGRDWPAFIEENSETGIANNFKESKGRNLCTGVIGAGLDVVVLGGHIGFCPEELVDFALGIFFIDIMDDDLE